MKAKKLTFVGLILAAVMSLAVAIGLVIPKATGKAFAAAGTSTVSIGDTHTFDTSITSDTNLTLDHAKFSVTSNTQMRTYSASSDGKFSFTGYTNMLVVRNLGKTVTFTAKEAVSVKIYFNLGNKKDMGSGSLIASDTLGVTHGSTPLDSITVTNSGTSNNTVYEYTMQLTGDGDKYVFTASSSSVMCLLKLEVVADCEHNGAKTYTNLGSSGHKITCSLCNTVITASEAHDIEEGGCTMCDYEEHVHNYGSWANASATQHAKVCTVEGCGDTVKEDHTFVEGVCSVCGAKNGLDEKTVMDMNTGVLVEDFLTVSKGNGNASTTNFAGNSKSVKFEGATKISIVVGKAMHVHIHAKVNSGNDAGSAVIRSGEFDAACTTDTIVASVGGILNEGDYYVGLISAGVYNLSKNTESTNGAQIVISKIALIPADSTEEITAISLNKTTMELSAASEQLTATVTPWYLAHKTITWTSSNEGAATVANGLVTKVGGGSTTITAAVDGKSASCAVTTAAKVDVTSVTVSKTTLSVEKGTKSAALTASVLPANASLPEVTWSSSDEEVATVDQNGVVTGVGVGTANIIATADGKQGTCAVTVTVDAPYATTADCTMNILAHEWNLQNKTETWRGITVTAGKFVYDASKERIQWNAGTPIKFAVKLGANANTLKVELIDQSGSTTAYEAGNDYTVEFKTEEGVTSVVLDSKASSGIYVKGFKLTYVAGVAGHSADLAEKINLKFHLDNLPAGATATVNDEAVEIVEGVVTVALEAKQIADVLTLVVKSGEDTIITEEYSAKTYLESLIAKDDGYKAVAEALLVYGAAAQTYFNYNASNLATDKAAAAISGEDKAAYKAVVTGKEEGKAIKMNVAVESLITIRVDVSAYTGDVKVNGEDAVVEGKYVVISGIKASELNKQFTITVGSLSVKVCALTYAVLTPAGAHAAQHPAIANALVAYYNAIAALN